MADSNVEARPGDANRTKRQQEVADLQVRNKLESFTNVPVEPVMSFTAHSQSGKREKEIDIEVVGQVLFIDTHGVARLEADEAIGFAKRLDRAVQATR